MEQHAALFRVATLRNGLRDKGRVLTLLFALITNTLENTEKSYAKITNC